MPAKMIAFEEKLKQKIGPLLEASGFNASEETIEKDTKAVVYHDNSNPNNEVLFHVMIRTNHTANAGPREFNWLRIQILTSKKQFAVVPPLSEISTHIDEKTGWVYTDENGLNSSLNEIKKLVQDNLSIWFRDE